MTNTQTGLPHQEMNAAAPCELRSIMSFKAILFDMDGVLIDSEELMAKSGILALREYGIEPVPADFEPFVGMGEDRYIGGVAEKYGLTYITEMKDRAYWHFGQHVEEEASVPEGLADILTELKNRGYRMVVCTSADHAKVVHNLRAIGIPADFFDAVITGDMIVHKKPDPEIYLKGAGKAGCAPADCVVVEDAVSGIKAAHAGGMQAIGISSSFPAEYLQENAGPDYLISDMHELLDILQ